ncbi:MAG: SAM-dependent DNA methyltransferase, partial [Methanomicrobiales archaeon]|nr:SAM-dependent DNA methyltransferase [Methanomicrobiales archaeon]
FLLHDLIRWREALARDIARNNLELKSEQIASAVNRILFPLLLLRSAGDRHLVSERILDDLRYLQSSTETLAVLHGYADAMYSGDPPALGHLPDPGIDIVIDANILTNILDGLVSPDRRYDCSRMTANDIADLLHQYLSRTIRRSAAHQAVVVDTHDTVLSGSVVIPPHSLVDYMISGALQSARENRSLREVLPLRIFDPACGTGTVLLAAYRHLQTSTGSSLTLDERREVLRQSIFGLDTNRHAVAAARMLLFLELVSELEPVAAGTFSNLFHEVLGDLRHTILCGNALVGPEVEQEESWMFCPARERHALNPFSYPDQFAEIVASGGFDAVVCNPPEGPLEQREWIQRYFQRHYAAYHIRADRSVYFFEKALSLVCPKGTVAMILNSRYLRGSAGAPFRGMLKTWQVDEIVDLSTIPPGNPGAGLSLLRARTSRPARPLQAVVADAGFARDPKNFAAARGFPVDHQVLAGGGWTLRDTRIEAVLQKVARHGTPLEDVVMAQVHYGIRVTEEDPFLVDETRARSWLGKDPRCKPLLRPVIAGDAIVRYHAGVPAQYRILIPAGWTCSHPAARKNPWQWLKRRHPLIARHLQPFRDQSNAQAGPELWYETSCDAFWQGSRRKILFPARFQNLKFQPDAGRGVGDEKTLAFPSTTLSLAGILNSRLMAFFFENTVQKTGADREFFSWDDIARLPVYLPDLDRPDDRERTRQLEILMRRMLDQVRHAALAKDEALAMALKRKVQATDRRIDLVVYELYGLAPEEIAVVDAWREGASAPLL